MMAGVANWVGAVWRGCRLIWQSVWRQGPDFAHVLSIALFFALVSVPSLAMAQESYSDGPMDAAMASAQIGATMGQPAAATAFAPVAAPLFGGRGMGLIDHGRALDCMTLAIAYEAGNQQIAGQQAVGQVILNRLHAQRFPKSVCGVVFDGSERRTGCQFTFTCDGSIMQPLTSATMLTARSVAQSVLSGQAPDRVGGATHYHADYVLPYWAGTGVRVAKIGAHIFYRMPGDAVMPMPAAVDLSTEPVMPQVSHYRSRRRTSAYGPALARATPATTHSMFAPWGLPVSGAVDK